MSTPTVEIVQFRLRPGVEEGAFLSAVEESQAAIARLPGFISREVLRSDGLWVDVVHWRSEGEALAAAEAFPGMPEVTALVMMIDATQMTMLHLAQARAYRAR